MPPPLTMDDVEELRASLRSGDHTAFLSMLGRRLEPPEWLDHGLDPMSPEYRAQQMRLWQSLRPDASDYDPERDEQFDDSAGADIIASPGFFRGRAPGAVNTAGHHLIAMGQLFKASELVVGDVALEYGAGYGQIALTLARLGVEVDTVDINDVYNRAVAVQAEHIGVPVRPHKGVFGFSPRGPAAYDLVLFYESFHHCGEFDTLPRRLRSLLKPNGKVLMAGEPILNGNDAVPYPWGVRLDTEAVAVTAARGWLELGFSEDFLVALFLRSGFLWRRHDCEVSPAGVVHEFTARPDSVALATYRMPADLDATWHAAEPEGRWTRHTSLLPLHDLDNDGVAVIRMRSHAVRPVPVRLDGRDGGLTVVVRPGETVEVGIKASDAGEALRISSPTFAAPDGRQVGIFVLGFDYRG